MRSIKVLLLALVASVLVIGVAMQGLGGSSGPIGDLFGFGPDRGAESAAPTSPSAPDALPASAPPTAAQPVTVDYVHDGDTLFAITATGERLKVRLIGIDTPELGTECHAEAARDALRGMLPVGASALALHDRDEQDRYGRELLYLWTASGSFVNLDLVRAGHGEALRVGANDAYWPQLSAAEASARNAGLGLWGAC